MCSTRPDRQPFIPFVTKKIHKKQARRPDPRPSGEEVSGEPSAVSDAASFARPRAGESPAPPLRICHWAAFLASSGSCKGTSAGPRIFRMRATPCAVS